MSASPAALSPTDVAPAVDRHEAYRPLDLDVPIATLPADARRAAATSIAAHVAAQLRAGRSLFNVVHDPDVRERIGADGRARVSAPTPVAGA